MPPLTTNIELYGLIATALLIGALCGIIPLFIACYTFLNRFATKADLNEFKHAEAGENARLLALQAALENRLVNDLAANTGKLEALTSSIQLFVNETNRATGQAEGRTDLMMTLVKHQLETSKENV